MTAPPTLPTTQFMGHQWTSLHWKEGEGEEYGADQKPVPPAGLPTVEGEGQVSQTQFCGCFLPFQGVPTPLIPDTVKE